MTEMLLYVDARSGAVLDTVALSPDGDVSMNTGAAADLFVGWQVRRGLSPAEAFRVLAGYSNGYVSLIPPPDPARLAALDFPFQLEDPNQGERGT